MDRGSELGPVMHTQPPSLIPFMIARLSALSAPFRGEALNSLHKHPQIAGQTFTRRSRAHRLKGHSPHLQTFDQKRSESLALRAVYRTQRMLLLFRHATSGFDSMPGYRLVTNRKGQNLISCTSEFVSSSKQKDSLYLLQ